MSANTRTIFRSQVNDLGNLFIAGRNISIEANGRISSLATFEAESVVSGNITFTNTVTANSFASASDGTPTITSSTNISLNANGYNGGAVVIANSPLRLSSYTDAQIGSILASAGDVIFNSTSGNVQYYTGTAWK